MQEVQSEQVCCWLQSQGPSRKEGSLGYTAKLHHKAGKVARPVKVHAAKPEDPHDKRRETTVASCCRDHHTHELACGSQTTRIHTYTKTKQMQLRNKPSHFRRKSCGVYCCFLELWVTLICSVTSGTDTEQSPTVQVFLERALGRQECSVQIKKSFFFF